MRIILADTAAATCAGFLGRLLAKEGSLAVANSFSLIYLFYWLYGLSVPE
jgi:hypothetical protein